MRVALYARVSTSDQTVEPQLDALRSYASARCLAIVEEYIDQGVSGSKDRRPALDELMAKAKRRAFDALAVVKLDRLARSVRHLTQMGAELEALGIDLIVIDQGIDTSTPSGRLLFNVLGSIAEFEADLIRERTRAGLRAARKRGKRLGRPESLDAQSKTRARRMALAGRSQREIAEALGCSKSAVNRFLRELSRKPPCEETDSLSQVPG